MCDPPELSFLNNIHLTPGALPCMFKLWQADPQRHRGRRYCAHSEGTPCLFVSFLRPYSAQHPKYPCFPSRDSCHTLNRAHWPTFSSVCMRVCVHMCVCTCACMRVYTGVCRCIWKPETGTQISPPLLFLSQVLSLNLGRSSHFN